jgi:aspartyl protease family protein
MSKLLPLFIGGAVIVAIFSPQAPNHAPSAPIATVAVQAPAPAVAPMKGGTFILDRAPDGHFYTEAQVNGALIRFLVDTGASTIALSKEDAVKIGLPFTESEFTVTGEGAGGKIALKPVMLDRVIIGNMETANVEGVIVNSAMKTSLLGQSWLKRVGTVEITGDRMLLK